MLASAPANLPQKLISAHLLPSSLLEVVENALQGEGNACGVGDVEKGRAELFEHEVCLEHRIHIASVSLIHKACEFCSSCAFLPVKALV